MYKIQKFVRIFFFIENFKNLGFKMQKLLIVAGAAISVTIDIVFNLFDTF